MNSNNNIRQQLVDLSPKLEGYALSLTSDLDRAKDLLQETMLKALSNADKYRENSNLKAWAYAIMRNTFINEYRRNTKIKYTLDDEEVYIPAVYTITSSVGADSECSYKFIQKEIDNLEDGFKVPFEMYVNGYKYKEISEELNIPIGTVKSKIFITRKKLSDSLIDYQWND
ncbi:MAG: RNA polymerase sigma factor [Bacteroidales bacterium]